MKHRFFLTVILIIAIAAVFSSCGKKSNTTYSDSRKTVEETERADPLRFLYLEGQFRQNMIGNKFNVSCDVTNNASAVCYKNLTLSITYYSKSNSSIGTAEYTIYEDFPANTIKHIEFKVDRLHKANSIGLEIVDAKPK